jgi:hypothetical protein
MPKPPIPPVSEPPRVTESQKAAEPPEISEVPKADVAVEDESQHQALKRTLGIEAEALDFTVSFEEPVPPGKGRADMVLRQANGLWRAKFP